MSAEASRRMYCMTQLTFYYALWHVQKIAEQAQLTWILKEDGKRKRSK